MISLPEPAKVLTIAASDSGGAAGMQADLRAFAALGVYGMSVVTAVTAQNSLAVHAVQFMSPDLIAAQLTAVLSDYGAAAAKTGFLGRVETITAIAHTLARYSLPYMVVDPVLVNHRGEAMFPPEVTQAYLELLLPRAALVTPNRAEAALLTGLTVETVADGETAVRHLHARGCQFVLLKGLAQGAHLVDLFYDGQQSRLLAAERLETRHTHGAGDTLTAAVCAYLAQGLAMETAVARAHTFTHQAIQRAAAWHMGQGHGPIWPLAAPHPPGI